MLVECYHRPKRILFFGEHGVGKSSLVNTIIASITGHFTEYTQLGIGHPHCRDHLQCIAGSRYMKEGKEKRHLYPTFVDIMGLQDGDSLPLISDRPSINNVILRGILHGNLPVNIDLYDLVHLYNRGETINRNWQSHSDPIDIVVMVISKRTSKLPQNLLKTVYDETRRSGVPLFAVITNAEVDTRPYDNERNDVMESLDINTRRLLEIENYTDDRPLVPVNILTTDVHVLEFLLKIHDPGLIRGNIIKPKLWKGRENGDLTAMEILLMLILVLLVILVTALVSVGIQA